MAIGTALPFKQAIATTTPSESAVKINQTVTTDEYEFTITDCYWSDAVYPPDTSGAYNYYSGESGKHFFIVHARIKNLAGYAYILSHRTTVSFEFNGKYQYAGNTYTAVDNATKVDQSVPIDPLETVNLYICSLVPDEIMDGFDSVQVAWSFYDLESNSYPPTNETAQRTYQFSYSQEEADQIARDKEIDAKGIPLDALVLNDIRIDLDDTLYAFQLHNQTGWAWTSDGTGSICLSSRENLGMPASESDQESFFAERVATYAQSQGWSITRSEKIALADNLTGFLNQAEYDGGSYTAFINIATGTDEFIQIDIAGASNSADETSSLLDEVIASIRKQSPDDLEPCAPKQSTSYSTAGISFDSCISLSQQMSYDSLYLFDANRTVQAYIETYGGPADSDQDSVWPNLFQYSGEYAPTAPEWPADYAQQFAAAHNGWILGTLSLKDALSPTDAFVIRAEPSEGPSIYVIAIEPQASGHPTVVTLRSQLDSSRTWSPILDAMLNSIEVTGTNGFWSCSVSSQYDWGILMPAVFNEYSHKTRSYSYTTMFTTDTGVLFVSQATLVATRSTYYPFGIAGDNLTSNQYMVNQWETTTPNGTAVRLTEARTNGKDGMDIFVDIHSSTNDCRYIGISLNTYLDRDYAMPLITQLVDGITW